MLTLDNVSKSYKHNKVLKNVSFTIGSGMNLIIGPSGSGKTSLLKILSGMDHDYEGKVQLNEQDLKTMSSNETSYLYNKVFGFIWQDFNLVEEASVLENLMIPQALQSQSQIKEAKKILKNLGIQGLEAKKVKFLSGGQKQRVAIGRELLKNPEIIFADEPCSALDAEASVAILAILRKIAKTKTVILVTHDQSVIESSDAVFELEKGELITEDNNRTLASKHKNHNKEISTLKLKNAIKLVQTKIKNNFGKTAISLITLMLGSVLLLSSTTGAISGQKEFDTLYETYGDTFLDINIVNSFMNASGTGGADDQKPNGDVNQEIAGIYDTYAKDPRIEQIAYLQPLDEISVNFADKTLKPKSSGNMPMMNKLIAGTMPNKANKGVVVPKSLVKEMGLSADEALGKEIEVEAWIYVDEVRKPINVKTPIIGVMETTVKGEFDTHKYEFELEDAFLFAKEDILEISKQSGKNMDIMPFSVRPQTAEAMIEIKDELNAKGIVPLGQFELVSDFVRLNQQSNNQSETAKALIAMIALLMVAAVVTLSTHLRSREMAIFKVSGFNRKHLMKLNAVEWIITATTAFCLSILLSPILNIITSKLLKLEILSLEMAIKGLIMMMVSGLIAFAVSSIQIANVDASKALKAGDR